MGGNQITKFSRLENHITKYRSDLRTLNQDILENLGLQMSGISRQHTPSMLVSIGEQHSYLHQVLLPILPSHNLWLHHCVTHRIPIISNWNFCFFRFKSVWLQVEFFEVSHSFDFWLRARRRRRFAGEHFAKWDSQKTELDFMLIAW